jgi:hypothetical protein
MSTDLDGLLDGRDHASIVALPPATIDRLVRRALDRYLSGDELVDVDRLLSLGVTLSRVDDPRSTDATLDWVGPTPPVERLAAAAALLMGLWQGASSPAGSGCHCADDRVARFLDAADRPWDTGQGTEDAAVAAAYLTLRTLGVAVGCGPHSTELLRRARTIGSTLASTLPPHDAQPLLERLAHTA